MEFDSGVAVSVRCCRLPPVAVARGVSQIRLHGSAKSGRERFIRPFMPHPSLRWATPKKGV